MGIILMQFPFYLLVGLRLTGLFVMSPLFGRRNIPILVKAGLALMIAFLLLPTLTPDPLLSGLPIYAYWLACIMEFLMGMVMGFLTTLFLSIAFTAGQLMDMQMGFGMVNVLDPHSQTQVPLLGNLLNILGLLIFLGVDGHLGLIRILTATFVRIPPGKINLAPQIGPLMAEYFVLTFILAIQVALPVLASALMAETALAMIMRTVPQMNVFVIGIPLKILLGFLVLMVIIPIYGQVMVGVFDKMMQAIERAFAVWAPV